MLLERWLSGPISKRDRVTATEIIDGIRYLLVLEQNMFGRYCEALVLPIETGPDVGNPARGRRWTGNEHYSDVVRPMPTA